MKQKPKHGFQLERPANSKESAWIEVECNLCHKKGYLRACEVKKKELKGEKTHCGNSCARKAMFPEYRFTPEKEKEIKEYAELYGTAKAGKKYSITRYKAAIIAEWNDDKRRAVDLLDLERNKEQREAQKLKTNRKYREKNKERLNAKQKMARRNKFFALSVKRHGKGVTAWDYWKIAKKQRMRCYYSGLKLDRDTISVEHIIPTSKGGLNIPENIVFVHVDINRMKLDHSLEQFKEYITILYKNLIEKS